jgi:predicted dehydrogenase
MDEAWELYKVVKETGLVLSVGFQPRFSENMKDIKRIVQSGVLGKIYYIQTGGGRRHGIPFRNSTAENTFVRDDTAGLGALADIGCYSLDLVLNALGHPRPLTVTGYKSDYFGKDPMYYAPREDFIRPFDRIESITDEELDAFRKKRAEEFTVDDFAAGFIRLDGGIILDFRIAWAMHLDTPGDTIFYGTKGSLRVPSSGCWNGSIEAPLVIHHEVAGKQVETVIPLTPDPKPDELNIADFKARSFLDACRRGSGSPVPIDEIIYNQAIIDGIVRSSEVGRELELDFSVMDEMNK